MLISESGCDAVVLSGQFLKLLKENEGDNSVRSKAEVVRSKALPQREKTLLSHNFKENILQIQGQNKQCIICHQEAPINYKDDLCQPFRGQSQVSGRSARLI